MLGKRPETGFQRELTDINEEFLLLAIDPSISHVRELLGLPAATLKALRSLSRTKLQAVAEIPLLLAEFNPLPGSTRGFAVADARPLPNGLSADWVRQAEAFANRLLACVWQATRDDRLLSAFCVGIDRERHQALANLSFTQISEDAATTLHCLRVRLGEHPNFWPDLIRAIEKGNSEQQHASRLSMIPLTIASSGLPTSTAEHPRYF